MHVAFEVVGDGPVDVLVIPGWVCHLDLWWNAPTDHLIRQLASFSRLIIFDKRGTGLSDRPANVRIEQWVDDAHAVLDAAGSERVVVIGLGCASTPVMFAATHPQRTSALVLFGTQPRSRAADGYPYGYDDDTIEAFIDHLVANWGTSSGLSLFAPSLAGDPDARAFWARYQQLSASPSAAAAFLRAVSHIDVRSLLPHIDAPALVLHVGRDRLVSPGAGQHVAALLPDATYVELDSDIHLIWLSDVIAQLSRHIEQFINNNVQLTPARDHRPIVTLHQPHSSANRE